MARKTGIYCDAPGDGRVHTRLLVGDCVARAGELADGCADVVFADPRWNIGECYGDPSGKSDRTGFREYLEWTKKWLAVFSTKLRRGGAFFVYVPDEVAGHVAVFMDELELVRINWIIVHYEFGQYNTTRFIRSKAHLHYYVRAPVSARTWKVQDVLVPSRRKEMGDSRIATAQFEGMRPALDVWYGPYLGRVQGNDKERRHKHPNQLRELLLARIIRATTNKYDLVVDPFCGSGTTQTVARALGRSSVGFEIVPSLASSAWERIIKIGPVRNVAARGLFVVPERAEE